MSEWKLMGSGRPLTAEKQLRSQALLGWICVLQSGTETTLSPSTSPASTISPLMIHSLYNLSN